jgi:hypothetical protein
LCVERGDAAFLERDADGHRGERTATSPAGSRVCASSARK